MKRSTFVFALMLGCAQVFWAVAPPALNSIRAIHSITNAEAAKALPVEFEATVTYFRGYEHTLFVQDDGIGIYVQATTDLSLQPGDRILIRGVTDKSFRPIVESSAITLLHHGSLPAPISVTFQDLIRSRRDSFYVKVRGTVRGAVMSLSSGRSVTQLEVLMDSGYASVIMDNSDPAKLDGLLDSVVEIDGVCSGRFDGKMQQTGVLLHVTDFNSVKIISKAAIDAWSTPVTPMDQVLMGSSLHELTPRVRVQGILTYYHPTVMAILQDGDRSIRVLTTEINPLRVGDRAEAIGIPFVDNGFLTLKLGVIRSTGTADPVTPVPVTWDDLASGKHSFDLVSIEGKVVSQVREASQDVYIISAGDHLFSATVRHPFVYEWGVARVPPPMPEIAPGSMVRATGVAMLDDGNPFNGSVAFGILLRSASDVKVIAKPTLLNVPNLLILSGLLLLVVFAVITRGWFIERNVRRKTSSLAYIERRRGRILEDINGSRPLSEVIEEITELVSFTLRGAPCWCELADKPEGPPLGNCPPRINGLRVVKHGVAAHSGQTMATLFAAFDSRVKAGPGESESLTMAAGLTSLAIETRRLYSDLLHRSEYDLLTGVHNRFSLEKHLDAEIEMASLNNSIFGLIYIDLDRFKQINDLYGHKIGDVYLQEVTIRMQRQLRTVDTLARIGGDEFAALVPEGRSRMDLKEIAQRLERCFDDPFLIQMETLQGSASVGIALYPEDGATKDSLLNAADAAMYAVKNGKRHLEMMIERSAAAKSDS